MDLKKESEDECLTERKRVPEHRFKTEGYRQIQHQYCYHNNNNNNNNYYYFYYYYYYYYYYY